MDFSNVKHDLVSREFLAVVLAGFGNELLPLTSDFGDEPCPKALLPVANKPMLEYVFTWLEQSGIKDVLLVCPAIHRPAIYHHIHSDISSSSLRIDLQTYDETQSSSVGTCTLLRYFSTRITEDFVLVPCDFIPPPSLPLSALLNKFRVDAISTGSIATSCWYTYEKPEKSALVEEWGPTPSPVSALWDETTQTLLHISTPDDPDYNSGEIALRTSLLSGHPRTRMSCSLQDSHVYVCRRTVLDVLHQKPHFDSFREEFLPWLCKIQYQRRKREKYEQVLHPNFDASQRLALQHSTYFLNLSDLNNMPSKNKKTKSIPSSPTDSESDHNAYASLSVGVHIHSTDTGFASRINSIHSFMEINRRMLGGVVYTLPSDPANRSLIDHKAQISSDTIIGESTQISERASVKKSVIGRHCIIGRMTKITGCVLFDHCVVEDGVKLEGTILGKNTKVGSHAEVSKCITQAGYEIRAKEILKNEKLSLSDWTAASEDDVSEEENSIEHGEELDDSDSS